MCSQDTTFDSRMSSGGSVCTMIDGLACTIYLASLDSKVHR